MSAVSRHLRVLLVAVLAAALTLTASPALAIDAALGSTETTPVAPQLKADRPRISGQVVVGQKLTASAGTWTPRPSFAFQWLRNGAAISGARATSYTLTATDAGKRISVRVTGTLAGYPTASATSDATGPVAKGKLSPKLRIKGTPRVGYTLTAVRGTWGSGVTYTYRWYANGRAIKNATSSKLKVTAPLYRKRLSLKVTGTKAGYTTATKTVKVSKKTQAGKLKTGKVKVSGTKVVFRTLTAKVSGWGPKGVKYRYQWYVGNTKIRGATKKTYKIPSKYVGKRLRVQVTVSLRGYATVKKTSARTTPVNWVRLDAACLAPGRVICADKSKRKVFRVQNGKILDSYDARFGRAGMRTRNGVWPLYYRSANQWSALYKVWMPYAEFFSGGQGVHYSAEFASIGYSGPGSHGCINLRDYAGARRIFNWSRVGDTVVVVGRDR